MQAFQDNFVEINFHLGGAFAWRGSLISKMYCIYKFIKNK